MTDWSGFEPRDPSLEPRAPTERSPSRIVERTVALLEVLLCSDYPTQFALGATFAAFGFAPYTSQGRLSVPYVVTLSLVDTALLIGLMVLFLHAHGERAREVFLGQRPVLGEARYGLLLTLTTLAIGIAVLASIRTFVPVLHNVEHNPLQDLMVRPRDAWLFVLVVVVAGGVREEAQRAFVLHRFEVWLGGRWVGLVVGSAAFGAGHLLQGADAAIATGLLGVFWGIVYLRRRSVVAPIVSHSGFNLLQIAQYLLVGG
jgi:membrane protease YdiL (CAAX protease family)